MNATFQQYFLPLEHHASPLPDPRASMALDPSGGAFQLERRQNLTLRDALGWTVQAVTGEVWITQDWDTRDVVLEAGQSFVIDRPGAALISALDRARVCVARAPNHCAAPARKARRASAFLTNSSVAA